MDYNHMNMQNYYMHYLVMINLNPKIYKHDTINKFDYFDEFFETYLDKRHIILLGVIWVALAGYISQDIIKANMAYEHGLKILKDFLNEYTE